MMETYHHMRARHSGTSLRILPLSVALCFFAKTIVPVFHKNRGSISKLANLIQCCVGDRHTSVCNDQ